MNNYPVLVSGYRSPPFTMGAVTNFNFQLIAGRGPAWAMDIMNISTLVNSFGSFITATVGGKLMIQNAMGAGFIPSAFGRCYELVRGLYQETQQVNIVGNNVLGAADMGIFAHFYHDNPLLENPEWMEALRNSQLGFKYQDYLFQAALNTKSTEFEFTLPVNRGDIVGLQLISDYEGSIAGDITVLAGGSQVFINTCLGVAIPSCYRPAQIHPIHIFPGDRIEMEIRNDNPVDATLIARGGVRVFYDGTR